MEHGAKRLFEVWKEQDRVRTTFLFVWLCICVRARSISASIQNSDRQPLPPITYLPPPPSDVPPRPPKKIQQMEKEAVEKREAEEKADAMKALEHRTIDSKLEMDIMDALEETKVRYNICVV